MRARTLLSTATLLASAACASLPSPSAIPAPAVTSGDAPSVAVWTPGTATGVGSTMSGTTYFAADRAGYATAFAVTRDGRLRVVWPESPGDDGRVEAGKTYRASASYAPYGAWMTGARNAVPYVFVIVSDRRPDLSRFGAGSRWKYQVSLDKLGHYAEDAIETVASLVLPGADPSYAADYAFIAPRLSGQAQMLTMYCGVRNTDARNYAYFRDLWATFDPWDNSLGSLSFASAWNFWPGALFPFGGRGSTLAFYADRASRASAAFWGGCPGLTPFTRLQYAYYYTAPLVRTQPPSPVLAPGDPLSPTMQAPGTTAPVDDGSGTKPGDLLRVRPSPVFAGPGVEVAAGGGATGGDRAERLARMRERMETSREERGRAELGAERLALRAERLEQLNVGRLEGRFRTLDLAERGISRFGDRNGDGAVGSGRDGRFGRESGFGSVAPRGARRGADGSLDGMPRGVARGSESVGSSGGGVIEAPRGETGSRTAGTESRGGGEGRTTGEARSPSPSPSPTP